MSNKETYILDLNNKRFIAGLKDSGVEVEKLHDLVKKTGKEVGDDKSGLGGRFNGLKRLVGVAAIGAGLTMITKKVVGLGAEMEQTRVAFSTFLGDSEKANKLIDQLNTFANVTPFNNKEIIKSGRLLLAAGIQAEDVTDNLKMIGDVAAGSNVPIAELAAIFQKATNKGKLQAEELNQLSERGIPIVRELAKQYGVNEQAIFEMGSKGQLTAQVMSDSFRRMTSEGGTFFNLMEKQSETTGGKLSTLAGSLEVLGIKLGEMLLPVVSKLADLSIKLVQNEKLLKRIATVVGIVAGAFLLYKVAVSGSAVVMGIMAALTGKWTVAQLGLNAALTANPIGIIVVAIGLLIGLVAKVIMQWDDWGKSVEKTGGFIGAIIGFIKTLWKNLTDIFNAFKTGGFTAGIKQLGATIISNLVRPFQWTLELIGKIPGKAGEWARKGAAKLEKFRSETLGVQTLKQTQDAAKDAAWIAEKRQAMAERRKANKKTATAAAAAAAGLPGANAGSITKTGLKAGISEVKAGAPKTFNINIQSLIKEQNFETVKDMAAVKDLIRAEVSKLLLSVVNDVQTS